MHLIGVIERWRGTGDTHEQEVNGPNHDDSDQVIQKAYHLSKCLSPIPVILAPFGKYARIQRGPEFRY